MDAHHHDVSALTSVVMRGKAWWIKSTGRDGTRGKVFDWPRREARRRGEELFRHDVDNFEFMCHNVINFPGSMKKKIMRGRTKYGGYGRTCGYGQKGAGTRGRRTINPGYEGGGVPIHHRTPRLTQEQLNSMKPDTHNHIPLRILNKCNDGEEVDAEELIIRGFAIKQKRMGPKLWRVKGGVGDRFEVKNLTVYAHAFEPAAREKIESNGGRCIRLHEIANIPIEAEFVRMDMQAMTLASEEEPGDSAEGDAIPEE